MANKMQPWHKYFSLSTLAQNENSRKMFSSKKGTNTPPDLPPAGGISSEEFNPSAKAYFV